MLTEFCVVAAIYADLPEADAAFSTVELVYEKRDSMSAFDAVTIGRKASGEVRFGRRHQQWAATGDGEPVGWSLAAGLAAALYPSVGVDLGADWLAESQVLSASAAAVQSGLDRNALSDLGEHLDTGSAGLIILCRPALERRVGEVVSESRGSISQHLSVDLEGIVRVCRRVAGFRSTPDVQS